MKYKAYGKWCALLAGTMIIGWSSNSLAVDPIIVNNFDSASEASSWSELTGNGVLEWLSADGGCFKVTLPAASGAGQVQPQVALASKSFNSAQYWSVSFDIKVDPSSGLSADGTTFGHWQVVARNSSWSWTGLNWTVLDSSYTTGWKHVEVGFVQPYDMIEYLVFQVQGDAPYAGDLIFYLDNIKINPLPLAVPINSFTNASEVAEYSAWGYNGSGISWLSSPDAGGATPAGSMQIQANYDGGTGWAEATCQKDFSFDPTRFAYMDLDLYLDPGATTTYGGMSLFIRQNHAPWNWLWIGGHTFSATDIGKWVHLSVPLAPSGETNAAGFVIQTGGNDMPGPLKIYVDNVKIWRPETPPALSSQFRKGGSPGATITMDNNTDQWQRDAIATPSGTSAYSWYGAGGVTYSFTIGAFPDAVAHPGFRAHMYIVNEDTIPQAPAWTETYGAADWNAADILVAQVANTDAGGVEFALRYKTNLPDANVDQTAITIPATTAVGTWSVQFGADNTSVTITGPGGISSNVSLPQEVADRFNCSVSFLQFGAYKDDVDNTGINNGTSMTYSHVSMSGGSYPFDDNFSGPGLTANNAWRTTRATAITWSPADVGLWISWSLPDDGFTLQVAGQVEGPYNDAGVTYTYVNGATRVAAVPAANIPAGNAFFRLIKPQ